MFRQTREQKQSYVNGLGLFFGALLGANMGVLTDLAPSEYLKVILLLAGVVLWIQVLSTSRSRLHTLRMLAALVLPAVILIAFPQSRPQGLTDRQASNMAATLAVWLVCVFLIEVTPLAPEPAAPKEAVAPAAPRVAARSGSKRR